MLPVLFSLTLQPSWALWALLGLALVIGAWQWRGARAAGDAPKIALQTFATWTAGSAFALYLAVRLLGDPGNNDIFHLTRPFVVPLHTYGLLIATAFLAAMWVTGRNAERQGLDKDRVMDLDFWILLAAMVGSRVLFIIVNWDDYARDPWSVFAFWKGGLVFYGGFLGAVAVSVFYMRKHKMSFFPYADAMIPAVSLGHAIGRMGCFAAGCCWGGACDANLAFAARFPPESLAYQSQLEHHLINFGALSTIPIHPTQIYESLGELCIFIALTFFVAPRKRFNGQVLAFYLMAYAPLRSLVEHFRGDEERGRLLNSLGAAARGAWWNLSTSEAISVGIFAAGLAIFVLLGRQKAAPDAAPA